MMWPTAIFESSTPAPPHAMNLRAPRAIIRSSIAAAIGGAHPRMHDGQTLAVDLNFVHRKAPDFAHVVIDLAGAAVENQVVDHVLKEAEYAVFGDVDAVCKRAAAR